MSTIEFYPCIRVAIADDHSFLRELIKGYLNKQDGIRVIGTAANGEELFELVKHEHPDLVITDIKMPVMDGIAATKMLKKSFPEIGVICLTMHCDDHLVAEMLESGADGYLVKSIAEEEIIAAIHAVYRSETYYCATAATRALGMLVKNRVNPSSRKSSQSFSEKEIQIMNLICQEFSNKEIAVKLDVSTRSVESTRERIQEKIGAKNMAGIVTYAIRNRIYYLD